MMPRKPFAMVPLPPARSVDKPRETGLTMVVDFGMPVGVLEDLLALAGSYIDLLKIAVGTSRLYSESYLARKIATCESFEVRPFVGGQFLEYVVATQGFEAAGPFFAEARRLGFAAVEVSDNCVPLTSEQRRRLIGEGVAAGLEIHGEVGSKNVRQTAEELITQARDSLDAGASEVLVEAAELFSDGAVERDMIAALRAELPAKQVIYELPGPWISGIGPNDVYAMKKFLIAEFGPDANIANVIPDDVLETEALRCGLSVVGPQALSDAAE